MGEDQTNPRRMLALSRLDAKKQLEIAIMPSSARVGRPPRAWRLVVAGDGDRVKSRRCVPVPWRSGGWTRQFPGWVAGAAKLALMRGASLFILPSHQENFGVAMAEAMVRRPRSSRQASICRQDRAKRARWLAEPGRRMWPRRWRQPSPISRAVRREARRRVRWRKAAGRSLRPR
jgi:glycosyltransferase involved in cell wall biosynthesis